MADLAEQTIINNLAAQVRSIEGVKNAYDFAKNPDSLNNAQLPAMAFWPNFEAEPKGHFNLWRNQFNVVGSLYVAPRQSGGRLKFLENSAMPFGFKFRQKFQNESVIQSLLGTGTGISQAWLISGNYGAGTPQLTYSGIEYIGWVFTWRFLEIN